MTRRDCIGLLMTAPLLHAEGSRSRVLAPTVVVIGPRIHRRVTLSDARFYFTGKAQLVAAVERARADYPRMVIGILTVDADVFATRLPGVGSISQLKPLPGGATEVRYVSLWEWEPYEIHQRGVYRGEVTLDGSGERRSSVLL